MAVTFLTDKDPVLRYDEQTLTEEQKAQARENIGVSGGNAAQGTGWTTEQIDLFDTLLSNIHFSSENGGVIADLLIASLRSGASSGGGSGESGGETKPDEPTVETYTITRNLTGCTSSSSLSSVVSGVAYGETLTVADGYTFDGANIVVTMGGKDITDTAYSDGVINIASVTGNIVIIVVAVNTDLPLYELAEATVFDGTDNTKIDTGVALLDKDKDWTIVIDMTTDFINNATAGIAAKAFRCGIYNELMLNIPPNNAQNFVWMAQTIPMCVTTAWATHAGGKLRAIATHKVDSGAVTVYSHVEQSDGKTASDEQTRSSSEFLTSDLSLTLGNNAGYGFTVNDFKIYNRVLSAGEISSYMAG